MIRLLPSLNDIIESILRLSTPIILAGLGGLLTQRAGVWNIGLEGFVLGGAFTAVLVSSGTGSPWLALLAAVGGGAALGLLMGLFIVHMRVDHFIAGLGIDAFAAGLTTFLMVTIWHEQQSFLSPRIVPLPAVTVSQVSGVPVIGGFLTSESPLVYLAWLLVPIVHIVLTRTHLGLRIRAVGDGPGAAAAAGVSVKKIQYLTLGASGALAGLAGAQLSIGSLSLFEENMSNGLGFLAFAAVLFGSAIPLRVALGGLFFGIAQELAIILAGSLIPTQIIQMTPYLFAILSITLATIYTREGGRYRRLGRMRARGKQAA
jgi:general nucleoside transport system permease protein